MAEEVVIKDASARRALGNLIGKLKAVTDREQPVINLLSIIIFRDLIEHFEQERGPAGKWRPWSPRYAARQAKRGRRQILQDTGRLRGGWVLAGKMTTGTEAPRVRKTRDGILWFNNVSYARKHNEGLGRIPKRQFAWVSSRAIENIEKQTIKFLGLK